MSSFSRSSRLTTSGDFEFVFAKPMKITRNGLILLHRSNSKAYPRLGILINKHQVPRAVDRNRIRRILRESFRQQKDLKAWDIIIIVRSPVLRLTNAEIREDIQHFWHQVS